MKAPCSTGCNMCGTCCVIYTIDDKDLQKPSYKQCPHLVYEGNKALCGIHATKGGKQPLTCQEYDAKSRQKLAWFDDRFKYYKQREFMEHWAWCAKHGYLDHLPIMQALKKATYSDEIAKKVYRYFIYPFMMKVEGTLAAEPGWFKLWPSLEQYLIHAPDNVWEQWAVVAKEPLEKFKAFVWHGILLEP
jgi:hypothetical protein